MQLTAPLKSSVIATLFATCAFAQTPVVELGNLAHTTESLAKTVPFYRDVLRLPMNGDPLAQQPQKLDQDMSKFTATTGMSFRAAVFRIPNAPFGFELTEFTGAPRTEVRPNLQDPGAATLVLQVRDIETVLARVRASGAPIVTIGGEPVNPTGNPDSSLREIVIRDPDGFFVELQQPDPLPASAAIAGDILGGSVQLSIEDSGRTVAFLRAALGFDMRPTSPLGTHPVVADLIGLSGAQWRITHGSIPGTGLDFGWIEYAGVPRARFESTAKDPGSPAVTLVVRDIDAAVDRWTEAGGAVVTTGGKAIVRTGGAGNVFVRDVNGLMWEFIQRAER